jgi:hypothetical protein
MSISNPRELETEDTSSAEVSSPVHTVAEKKTPLWLMILLAAITAIIFIWVMLIVVYPSLALS